ncbi:ATP-binding protein [Pseudoxanthomonas winnipegensis]|jgi:two-component system sensor histidine kinase RpfC|uniref:Sensory/regulatory protein RpfC n=1 Tax=Pseudoxanthomonas winnipegensis TaxID=2480810 RepID=A0A4Q8L5T6_9GAMM|nr:ATP-binding protein [Pseudoxanthomonas winnipegensis]TAA21833.1 response regulator [Pseudoxanthomonas winnipegensis]
MAALLQQFKLRLPVRRDNEHGQAVVRIALISLILMYVLLPPVRAQLPVHQYQGVLAIVLSGLSLGCVLLVWMWLRPERSDTRRIIGMLADYGLMAAGMIQMGEPLSWVYVVVMWVTVGNGMRYGNNYLYLAVAMAMVSFTTTVLMTDYWLANLKLAIGLVGGLAAVPLYFSNLLRKLTRASADARRASEAKSRFLANMSHEFRTPLNGLSGMTEVLATTRLDAEQRECLNTIQASARSLLALVEEVLDISAIEAGKLRLDISEFAPRELVKHVGFIMLPQARAKRLDYTVHFADDVPATLMGDARHLRQVLINLVGNAVKFTDRGGVRIQVATVPSIDARVRLRFTVIDTGVGIPPRLQDRLFEAFEQADVSLSRRYGGTGLGAAIAKGLTEAMGGSIGFESEVGLGSTFWVEVPFDVVVSGATPMVPALAEEIDVAEETAEAGAAPQARSENVIAFSDPFLRHRARVRSMQILVADDHEANRMVLQRLLQKAGHRVACVNGGEEVLDALAVTDYDAAIIDLHMPGMSGLDLLKELRVMQAGGAPRTPVVVLSADVTPQSISSCEQAGAHAFLAKPVVASKLLDTLNDIAVNGSLRQPQGKLAVVRGNEPTGASQAEVFDPRVLDELLQLGMGETFEQEFIQQCLNDAEACFHGMLRAGEAQDWDRMREHAHALKGVAGNLGMSRLAEESGQFMRMADWQMLAEWRQRMHQLDGHFRMGREALTVRAQQRRKARDGGER